MCVCVCGSGLEARVSISNLVVHFSPKLQDKVWNGNPGLRKVAQMKDSFPYLLGLAACRLWLSSFQAVSQGSQSPPQPGPVAPLPVADSPPCTRA